MRPRVVALDQCDDFHVSCERVFTPSLRGRAVVVLSNVEQRWRILSHEHSPRRTTRWGELLRLHLSWGEQELLAEQLLS